MSPGDRPHLRINFLIGDKGQAYAVRRPEARSCCRRGSVDSITSFPIVNRDLGLDWACVAPGWAKDPLRQTPAWRGERVWGCSQVRSLVCGWDSTLQAFYVLVFRLWFAVFGNKAN